MLDFVPILSFAKHKNMIKYATHTFASGTFYRQTRLVCCTLYYTVTHVAVGAQDDILVFYLICFFLFSWRLKHIGCYTYCLNNAKKQNRIYFDKKKGCRECPFQHHPCTFNNPFPQYTSVTSTKADNGLIPDAMITDVAQNSLSHHNLAVTPFRPSPMPRTHSPK